MKLLATVIVIVIAIFLVYVAMIPTMSDFAFAGIVIVLVAGGVAAIIRIWR